MTNFTKTGKGDLPTSMEPSEVSKAVKKSYKRYANGFQRPSVLLSLEPRMMFDGAAPAVVDDIIESTTNSSESLSNPNPNTESPTSELSENTDADQQASQAEENIAESQVLFNQLTNNDDLSTATDPAADLESTEDDYYNEETLESTLDDLSVNTDNNIEGTYDDLTSSAIPALLLNEQDSSEQIAQYIEEADVTETIDYTEKGEIERVVFFDTTVNGYEDLLEGLINDLQNLNVESLESGEINEVDLESALVTAAENDNTLYVNSVAIHLLQGEEGQIEQITETLASYSDLSAIDIVSHGSVGEVQLGSQRLNNQTLDTYSDLVEQWGNSLLENGDILLYGCNVAGHGQEFLDNIAELTNADIAGSDDLTGNVEFGGDFELEAEVGIIEADELLTAVNAAAFTGTLLDTCLLYTSPSPRD